MPVSDGAFASSASSEPCVEIRSRAPFSPMPGTPLMLSMESPINASTSTTCSGATPNFVLTPSASYHAPSSRGLNTRTPVESSTSWKKSLSPVTIATGPAFGDGAHRQRADHVVGFEAGEGEHLHAERFARLVHERDLLREIRRHRRAIGFVVVAHLRPERRSGQVERRGDALRIVVGDELAQHRHEAVDGVGRAAVGPGQPAYRVVGAIHLVAAVDEKQGGFRQGVRSYLSQYIIWGYGFREARWRRARRAGLSRRVRRSASSNSTSTTSASSCRSTGRPSSTSARRFPRSSPCAARRLSVDPEARFDRQAFRRLYEGARRHRPRSERVPPPRPPLRARAARRERHRSAAAPRAALVVALSARSAGG